MSCAAIAVVTLGGCGQAREFTPTQSSRPDGSVALYATPANSRPVGFVDPSSVSYECWAPSIEGDYALVVSDDRSVAYMRIPVDAGDIGYITAADLRQCGSPSDPLR